MSSGQSARNGNSVEPGLPKTFLMPKARNRSRVACLTVMEAEGLRGTGNSLGLKLFFTPACRRRYFSYHAALAFIVGIAAAFAVHNSIPASVALALTLNSPPSNRGCTPR